MRTMIRGGRVVSPADRIDSLLNIIIEDSRIAALTDSDDTAGCDNIIEANGKTVTPGFIDIHMHEDTVGADGRIKSDIFGCMLRMGVTTVLGGNCGGNACEPGRYLDIVDRDGAPVNVAMLAGEGYFRVAAGQADRYSPVNAAQLEVMESGIASALRSGCMGLSYGIRYYPGMDETELMRTAACCKPFGGLIAAHVRDDASAIFGAVDEICRAAGNYGLPVQISHIGSMAGFGQMERLLAMLDARRAGGLDVMLDCYPYTAFSTELGETTYDDGWLERYNCDYSVLEYCEGEYRGLRADSETFARLRREWPGMLTVCHVMKEGDVDAALRHPAVMAASDGLLNDGQGHPRAAGCFPRVFSSYVRTGKMSLYDAVSKITALPAARMKLTHKGRIAPGADADIVIFDADRIRDRSTFENPTLAPEGIDRVIIAGKTAVLDGEITADVLGKAVRRQS